MNRTKRKATLVSRWSTLFLTLCDTNVKFSRYFTELMHFAFIKNVESQRNVNLLQFQLCRTSPRAISKENFSWLKCFVSLTKAISGLKNDFILVSSPSSPSFIFDRVSCCFENKINQKFCCTRYTKKRYSSPLLNRCIDTWGSLKRKDFYDCCLTDTHRHTNWATAVETELNRNGCVSNIKWK